MKFLCFIIALLGANISTLMANPSGLNGTAPLADNHNLLPPVPAEFPRFVDGLDNLRGLDRNCQHLQLHGINDNNIMEALQILGEFPHLTVLDLSTSSDLHYLPIEIMVFPELETIILSNGVSLTVAREH